VVPPNQPWLTHDVNSVLNFQELADSRFTTASTVSEKQIQIDPCASNALDVNVKVASPLPTPPLPPGFGSYKSVILGWWENSSTPRPQPGCTPTLYNFFEISMTTGGDDLRGDSGATATLLGAEGAQLQNITLKANGQPGWGNNTTNDQRFQFSSPISLTALGSFVISLIESDPHCSTGCDNWDIQNISVRAFNTSDGQIGGTIADQACLLSQGGTSAWTRLTRDAPTASLTAFAGCTREPKPQFSTPQNARTGSCPITETIIDQDPAAAIFYTMDGSIPTTSSAKYIGPLTLSTSETLNTLALGNHIGPSDVATANYSCANQLTVNLKVFPGLDPGLFNLMIDGVIKAASVRSGGSTGPQILSLDRHTVAESGASGTNVAGYKVTFGGDCDSNGVVALGSPGAKVCTITVLAPPRLDLEEVVVPDKDPGQFDLFIDGKMATGGALTVGSHTVSETAQSGTNLADYVISLGGDCVQSGTSPSGTVSLALGDSKTCSFANKRKPETTTCTPPATICCPDTGGACTCITPPKVCNK
jgi:hypothetical protein